MTGLRSPYADAAAMRRRYALHLLAQGSSAAPVQHPLQAVARALQGGLGGLYARQLHQEELEKTGSAGEGNEPATGKRRASASPAGSSR